MLRRILLACGLIGVFVGHMLGQQQAGQISGVVTDSTGAVTPGATVKAIEVGTGFVRTTIAGAEGEYVLPSLRPTEYELTAEHAGFRTFRRTGISLLANQSLTLNIKLELGAVSETINVAGAAIQVNTSTSTLSEVIDRARILEMPLNGRDVARLAVMIPGMSIISVSSESGKSIPGGLQLTSNGTRNQQVSLTGSTAQPTPTRIFRRTRPSRSRTRCRSSRSRRATIRPRRATTPERSSTS